MLVKVFSSKSPLNKTRGKLRHRGGQFYSIEVKQSLEEVVNRWLAQNPMLILVFVLDADRDQQLRAVFIGIPRLALDNSACSGLM